MKKSWAEDVKPAIERFGGGEGVHNQDATLGFGLYLDESYGSSLSLPFGISQFAKNLESKHYEGLLTKFNMTTIQMSTQIKERPGCKYTYSPNGATSQYNMMYPAEPGDYYLSGSIRNHSCNTTVECDSCEGTGICQECEGRGYNMCRHCEGTGKVDKQIGYRDGKPQYRRVACPRCQGSGEIICSSCRGTKKCSNCSGSGKVTCDRCNGTGNYQTYDVVTCKFGNASLNCSYVGAPIVIHIPDSVIEDKNLICKWSVKNVNYNESKSIRSTAYQEELSEKLRINGFSNPDEWSEWVGNNLSKKEKELLDKGKFSVEMSAKSYGCPITCYKYQFEGSDYATYVVGRRPTELYGTYPTSYFWEHYKLKISILSKIKRSLSFFQSKKKRLSDIRRSLVLLAARMMIKSQESVSLDKFYESFKLEPDELDFVKAVDVENLPDKDFYKMVSNLKGRPAAAMWAYTFANPDNNICYRDAATILALDDGYLCEHIEAWYAGHGFRNYGENFVLDWFASKIS